MADPNTTENWRPVVGYEGYYEVSDQGRVRSITRIVTAPCRWGGTVKRTITGRILSQKIGKDGRHSVHLSKNALKKMCKVHLLVLESFVGMRPENMVCRHFPDRSPSNNCLANLQWGTRQENEADKLIHGTRLMGEASATAKITLKDVETIFSLEKRGLVHRKIAGKIGISRCQVSRILRGENWAHYSPSK